MVNGCWWDEGRALVKGLGRVGGEGGAGGAVSGGWRTGRVRVPQDSCTGGRVSGASQGETERGQERLGGLGKAGRGCGRV